MSKKKDKKKAGKASAAVKEKVKEKDNDDEPSLGTEVMTACGGFVHLNEGTPRAIYAGQTIYFCLPICKKDFEQDPATSCLAPRMHEFE